MTSPYTTKTWKSKTTRRRCGRPTIVGVGSLWRSRHAFGDLVEAVTNDLVDLLLAGGKIESGRKSVWWQLSKLCSNLFGRDGAEVGVIEDLNDGRTEDGDDGRVERSRLRHDGGSEVNDEDSEEERVLRLSWSSARCVRSLLN